jgi:hypothetical protein
MRNSPRLAALAAVLCVLAASPAFAATAVCTAKDSAGKHYTEKQTGLLDFSVKTIAEALAKADCQDKSRHPETCVIVSCKVTK